MWKFTVYWILITHTPKECDCNKLRQDEFGRTVHHSYALYCEDISYDHRHKDFVSSKEAIVFYQKAKNEIFIIPNLGTIDSVRIDSTYIKP